MEDWLWSVDGACDTCLYVECQCSTDTEDIAIDISEEKDESFEIDDRQHDYARSVTQQTIRTGLVMRWERRGAFTTVNRALERTWDDFTDDELFMREVRLWAVRLPEDTDEIVGWAMLKYAELLESHPTSSFKSIKERNAYYMTAIKNNQYDRGRKRKLDEECVQEMPVVVHRDIYSFQVMDWFSELSSYARKAVLEAMQWIDENPDKRLPERIQRRLRKINTRPDFN